MTMMPLYFSHLTLDSIALGTFPIHLSLHINPLATLFLLLLYMLDDAYPDEPLTSLWLWRWCCFFFSPLNSVRLPLLNILSLSRVQSANPWSPLISHHFVGNLCQFAHGHSLLRYTC